MSKDTPPEVKILDGRDIWDVTELFRIITPEDARELLKLNTHNRSPRRATVDRLKSDIKAGHFLLNGDTIVIGSDNTILNGQNRLFAIGAGTKPVKVIIIKGVDPKAFPTFDVHVPRNLADHLNIHGVKDYTRVSQLVLRAERWDSGLRGADVTSGSKRLGAQGYIDFYDDNVERITAALRSPNQYDNIPVSLTSLFRYIIGDGRAQECDTYLREASTGRPAITGGTLSVNMSKVFAALVNTRSRGGPRVTHHMLGILLTGWNARQQGKCVRKLPFEGGPLPDPVDA